MGDEMKVSAGEKVHFVLTLRDLAGAHAEVVRDGVVEPLGDTAKEPIETREFDQISDGKRHWVRVNVRERTEDFLSWKSCLSEFLSRIFAQKAFAAKEIDQSRSQE